LAQKSRRAFCPGSNFTSPVPIRVIASRIVFPCRPCGAKV
jgi:hypothetical protein